MTGGEIRASDADRDQVAEVLHTAYAEGRLTADEHAERTTALLRSRTFDDLAGLTADLVPTTLPVPRAESTPATTSEPARLTAMLASAKRVGPWRVPRSTAANVLLGDVLIDLTEATFESPVVEVTCAQFLGSTKIRVPVGTNVTIEAANILGDSSIKEIGPPDPSMPTVIVRGFNVMGDIQVRGPKKPPPWRRKVA